MEIYQVLQSNETLKQDLLEQLQKNPRRFFNIAGITVCVESVINLDQVVFKDELNVFAIAGPGEDNVTLSHTFELPVLEGVDLGAEVYNKAPWAIYKKNDHWIYLGILPSAINNDRLHRIAVFSPDYRKSLIYNPPQTREQIFDLGFQSLSLMPTDQIWLAPLLADRKAVLLHSAAAIINGQGFIFVGHSDAGKTTTMELLMNARSKNGLDIEVLCDDRNIVRHWPDGWCVHGTWSHGDIAAVSPSCAPLRAVLFLEQAEVNKLIPITDRKLVWKGLLATLIRSMVTDHWWQSQLDILEQLVAEVSCYRMRFDKTGAIVPELERLTK